MKNAFNAKDELLNLDECPFWTFYEEESNRFILLEYDAEDIPEDAICLPFVNELMPYAKKVFRSKLTPKELELATSFYERHGYFAYLEEIGLIDVFREAEDEAIWILIEDWEDEHDLSIDWDTVYIA
jgi:hypothetical protein